MTTIIAVIIIWVIAPFAELGIILGLTASNSRYKKRIQELTGTIPVREPVTCKGYDLREASTYHYSYRREETSTGTDEKQTGEGKAEADCGSEAGSGMGTGLRATRLSNFSDYIQNNLGSIALVIGVILVALSGLIFATTRWQVLSELSKTLLVFAASGLFFGASVMAERSFGIRRTGNAFYTLGSVFLCLTVTAAAYFQLLGPRFTLEEENRWLVLWAGSMVLEGALIAGLRRFHDRIYSQAVLWTLSASLCFLAKNFGAEQNELMGVMACMGAGLSVWQNRRRKEALGSFLPVHFTLFCIVSLLVVLSPVGLSSIFWVLCLLFSWDTLGGCVIGFGILGALALVCSSIFEPRLQRNAWRISDLEQAGIYSLAGVYSLAGLLKDRFIVRITAVCLWFAAVQLYLLWKRRQESVSRLWEACGLTALVLGVIGTEGNREWLFFYLLFIGVYGLRYGQIPKWRKAACTISACFFAAAFWEQPFIHWPQVIRLECLLLPAALLLWAMGRIWGRTKTVEDIQTLGYTLCLVILGFDGIRTALVWDALILEGICLAVFLWAQVKKSIRWVRISGSMILMVAVFMTRAFWLSISWWLYLLAAGIGLILFAAVREQKHH